MNKKQRNTQYERADALTATNGGPKDNLFDLDAKIYGDVQAADSTMQIVEAIRLSDISPDPGQPRRIIPAAVRAVASGKSIPHLYDTWAVMAFQESSGNDAPAMQAHELYRAMIEGRLEEEGWQLPEKPGQVEASILKVATLAASIYQNKLSNPITVAPAPEGLVDTEYIIETGERRYRAYQLLNFYYGPDWLKIPAKVQPKVDVWRQADENNQRDDLNAIGKARQLSILLMDLLQQEEYITAKGGNRAAVRLFAPITGFAREQEYYAQVADAKEHPVPYGKADLLLNAMGISNRATLSEYRLMLRLPPEVWVEADDKGYSLHTLREIVRASNSLDDERPDFTKQNIRDANNSAQPSAGNLSQVPPAPPQKPAPSMPPVPSPASGVGGNNPKPVTQTVDPFRVGAWVKVVGASGDGSKLGIVTKRINPETAEVEVDGRFHPYALKMLMPIKMEEGMAVMTRTRHVGWIVGGVGSGAVQVKYNGSVTVHHPDTLKPVNKAPERAPEPEPQKIQRLDLTNYPEINKVPEWADRYKYLGRLRPSVELLFIQTSYGHMALRDAAKASEALMRSTLPTAWRTENSEHGMAFFALEYRVIEEIAKQRPVAIYVDHNDVNAINTFWANHVLKQKSSFLGAPAQQGAVEFAIGDVVTAKGYPGQELIVIEVHPDPKTGDPQKTLLTLRSEKVMIPLILVTQVTKIDDVDSQPPTATVEASFGYAQDRSDVPEVSANTAMDAFVDLVGGEFTEDDLEAVRLFWIQKSHELGLLTPWDSDVAMVVWQAEDGTNGNGIREDVTLERIEAAQQVLANARRWLEK